MCGIVGMLERGPVRRSEVRLKEVRTMMALVRHRGPDGAGILLDGPLTFGHRRLAIVDLAGGFQPLTDPSGRFSLIFNGEIYNAPELRRQLLARGCMFRSHSDSEVLLQLLAEEGLNALPRLNGMFAFALWDRRDRSLLLVRDRFGIKPLYVLELPDRLLFASEAKALVPFLPDRRLNPAALADYFTYQLCLEDRAFMHGIERLLPATATEFRADGSRASTSYWSVDFTIDPALTPESVTQRIGWLLDDAIRINLMGDVPVGAYLSGGLDSSSVVMMASGVLGVSIPCFAGGFHEGPAFDETPFARQVARAAGAELLERFPTPEDLAGCFHAVAHTLDEPMAGPGALPQYLVAQLASTRVKVVLGGQGGDEIFGGYARYLLAYLEECLRGAIFDTQRGGPFVVTFESILPNLPLLEPYVPLLRQFWSEGLFGAVDERYLRLLQKFMQPGHFLTPDWQAAIRAYDPGACLRRDFNRPDLGSLINKMTYVDQRHFLPALLQVEDRVSMAWSVESRVPLLDHRLVELLARTPPTIKFAGGELKGLLKRAMSSLVPETILQRRDKLGFPVPLNRWALGPLRACVREILLGEAARARGLFDPQAVEAALSPGGGFERDLWGLLAVELWCQRYLDAGREALEPSEAQIEAGIREEVVFEVRG